MRTPLTRLFEGLFRPRIVSWLLVLAFAVGLFAWRYSGS